MEDSWQGSGIREYDNKLTFFLLAAVKRVSFQNKMQWSPKEAWSILGIPHLQEPGALIQLSLFPDTLWLFPLL